MSPALAHRDINHNKLIESMTEQMIEIVLQEESGGLCENKTEIDSNVNENTTTGICRVGNWEKLDAKDVEDETCAESGVNMPTSTMPFAFHQKFSPGCGRVGAALSQSLALAQALSLADSHPNSSPNYQNSFGYVEPQTTSLQTREFIPSLDLSFTLEGAAISAKRIVWYDVLIQSYVAASLIQRYDDRIAFVFNSRRLIPEATCLYI